VARNVAEVLARLGDDVSLVSVMGRDRHGQMIASQLTEAGVDLSDLLRDDDDHTATYTALVEPEGSLYVGLADMAIYAKLTPDALTEAAEDYAKADAWFIDANLPPESITWLASRCACFLAANTVSVPKARRIAAILNRLDLLVCNREEAAALVGEPGEPADHAAWLDEQGVGVVAITTHEEGAIIAFDGEIAVLPAPRAEARDVTGAGDAVTGAMIHALLRGRDALTAAKVAMGAAAITVEADASVAESLSEDAARLRVGLTPDPE